MRTITAILTRLNMLLCIPRCETCGEVIDPLYREYIKRIDKGQTPKKIMNSIEFRKLEMCCKMRIQTTQEGIDMLLRQPSGK